MNAKQELLKIINENNKTIKCADIKFYGEALFTPRSVIYSVVETKDLKVGLKIGYSESDLKRFYEQLDFQYNSGYGGQELFGNVWFTDGSWLDRGEDDGSEWWVLRECPKISETVGKEKIETEKRKIYHGYRSGGANNKNKRRGNKCERNMITVVLIVGLHGGMKINMKYARNVNQKI
jgi:hypothetical protein